MTCPNCKGKGEVIVNTYYYTTGTCEICEGWGKVTHVKDERIKCHSCRGTGLSDEQYEKRRTGIHIEYGTRKKTCYDCDGKGYYKRSYYKPIRKHDSKCFITSSTLQALGLKEDNCYTLETFRNYRDNWLVKYHPNLVSEYYEIAPRIVKSINLRKDNNKIYKEIWNKYLKLCLILLEQKEFEKAKIKYKEMVNNLKNLYM